MRIDFHARGFFYGDVAQDYAKHRLGFALGRFADVIRKVDVQVEELRGVRSGVDKRCKLQVYVEKTAEPIITSMEDTSLKAAIDVAADRVSRAVQRHLQRRRKRSRSRVTM